MSSLKATFYWESALMKLDNVRNLFVGFALLARAFTSVLPSLPQRIPGTRLLRGHIH